MDDGSAAGGTGMCRVRRSVRPDEGGEGIREADGLSGEKTFGLTCNKKWVFPKSLAPARLASNPRAAPSHSMGQSHIQSAAVQCTAPTAPPWGFSPPCHWPIVSPYSNNLCEQHHVYRRICPAGGHHPKGGPSLRADRAAARAQAARQVSRLPDIPHLI